nr:hypothetical protein [Actinomycetota bacterium]
MSTWPALREARSAFLAEGQAPSGGAAPGDHLQAVYQLWLPGHQLERLEAPWRDPYSFQPIVEPRVNFAGWPFGAVFWPLHRLLGTVGAWNAFVLLSYAGAGLLTFAWLRSLGLGRPAALAGGLVFALAPYRVAQLSAGHLLAPVSMLLPLALWALEKRRTRVAAIALASIPLSGQVHLALGAIPFVLLLATVRGRLLPGALAAAAATAAGLGVYAASIRGSVGAGGRSFAQVERYSAELADLVSRDVRHGLESFALLGWLTPLLALGGLGLLAARRSGLALALGLGAVVPVVLALGGNLPLYEPLWRRLPGLHETRVPERLLPIACLCLAALAAFALERLRRPALIAAAVLALGLDLRLGVEAFSPTAADEGNAAYAALRAEPTGALLELPAFLPGDQRGSVYLLYATRAPRPRLLGYSTVAPPEADRLARRLRSLECGGTLPPRGLGVGPIVVHLAAYDEAGRPPACAAALTRSLLGQGYGLVA